MKNMLAQQKIDFLMKGLSFTSENTDTTGMYREYLLIGIYLFLAMATAFIFNLLFELSKNNQ